jgi:hypothetical protein
VTALSKDGKPKVKLMLDSGAFSAWKRGIQINLVEYISYIKKHEHLLENYVNLDVIPGSPGKIPSKAEVDKAARASHENLKKMHAAGLSPIPVFHFGEDIKWLELLLSEKEPYIGLGGLVGIPQPLQIQWLDQVFTRITDKDGWPIVKTHGFGVASFEILKMYPWFTCDATSWALTAAYGSIYVPVFKGDEPDYSQPPAKFTVSLVERKGAETPSDHYTRFGPIVKQRVERYLKEEVGVDIADAAKDYEVRARAIVHFMMAFEKAIGEKPFKRSGAGSFF